MKLADIFKKLIKDRQVEITICDGLAVQLTGKWNCENRGNDFIQEMILTEVSINSKTVSEPCATLLSVSIESYTSDVYRSEYDFEKHAEKAVKFAVKQILNNVSEIDNPLLVLADAILSLFDEKIRKKIKFAVK